MKARVIFFFIFFCQNILGFWFLPAVSAQAALTNPGPFVDITIKKNDEGEGKASYSLSCKGSDLNCDARKLNLEFEGNFKKDAELSILEISAASVGLDDLDPASFESYLIYKNKLLTFSYLKTRSFILTGTIDFAGSVALDLNIDIKGMSLKNFNKLWGVENFPFQGDFRGKVRIKGRPANIFVEGTLEAYQGNLEEYAFEKVFLNFRGTYPWVALSNSFAIIEGHNVEIEGALNLAKLYTPPCLYIIRADKDSKPSAVQFFRNGGQKKETVLKNTVKGFLALSGESNVLLYKLGSDSFIKLRINDVLPSLEPKLEF